jgi:hypothetical protein
MLNLNDKEFGSLPPHFDKEGIRILESIGYDRLLKGYDKHKPGYKRCVPFWIALVLHQLPTLKSWWKSDHPVWGALFFQTLHDQGVIDDLRTHIHLGYFKNEDTGLCATGVPKCVAILNEQRTTNTLLRTLPTLIIDTVVEKVTDHINRKLDAQDEKWSSRLVGNDACTRSDVQEMVAGSMGNIQGMLEELVVANRERSEREASREVADQLQGEHEKTLHLRCIYTRDNDEITQYFTPTDFKIPTCDVAKFFRFWHFGKCLPVPIGPFKILHQNHLRELSAPNRLLLCKGATVMRRLESIHFSTNDGVAITPINGEQVREDTMSVLISQLYSHQPRNWSAFAYTTLCKRISDVNPNRKRRRASTDEDD